MNAANQRHDPNSLLNWTERIIRIRKEVPEIGWGDFNILDMSDKSILAVRYDWRNNSVLTLHNFAAAPREIEFATGLGKEDGDGLISLLSDDHSTRLPNGKHRVCLDAYGYRWFRMGGLDYLLKRREF